MGESAPQTRPARKPQAAVDLQAIHALASAGDDDDVHVEVTDDDMRDHKLLVFNAPLPAYRRVERTGCTYWRRGCNHVAISADIKRRR